ncbi:MAG: phosphoadenosine phosphosulfate reductase family protein, partial [bacterium]
KADGLYKFVKSRGKNGRQVCMPIGFWHVEDVWEYIDKYEIKYPLVYDQEIDGLDKIGYKEKVKGVTMDRGMIRLGCWSCPLTIKYTDKTMKQLRKYYPKMWRFLMERGLANEIIKLKINEEESINPSRIDNWLDKRPCFFDHV